MANVKVSDVKQVTTDTAIEDAAAQEAEHNAAADARAERYFANVDIDDTAVNKKEINDDAAALLAREARHERGDYRTPDSSVEFADDDDNPFRDEVGDDDDVDEPLVDDEQSAEEAEDEDTDEEDGEDEEDELIEIKVDGKKMTVTMDELKKGYSRQQDYTRKTQALAADRGMLDKVAVGVASLAEDYAGKLEALSKHLPPALRDAVAQEWVQTEQYRTAVREQEITQRMQYEKQKLVEAIPEWSDPVKSREGRLAIVNYLRESVGATDEDFAQLADHRVLVLARKAMLYDKRLAKGKDIIRDYATRKAAGNTLRPGAPTRGRTTTGRVLAAATAHLKQTGTEDAAAAVFRALID